MSWCFVDFDDRFYASARQRTLLKTLHPSPPPRRIKIFEGSLTSSQISLELCTICVNGFCTTCDTPAGKRLRVRRDLRDGAAYPTKIPVTSSVTPSDESSKDRPTDHAESDTKAANEPAAKPDTHAPAKPQTHVEPKPATDAKPKSHDVEPKPATDIKPTLPANVKAEPEIDVKPKPKTDSKAKPTTDINTKAHTDTKAKPTTDIKATSTTDIKATPTTDIKPKPTTDSKSKSESDKASHSQSSSQRPSAADSQTPLNEEHRPPKGDPCRSPAYQGFTRCCPAPNPPPMNACLALAHSIRGLTLRLPFIGSHGGCALSVQSIVSRGVVAGDNVARRIESMVQSCGELDLAGEMEDYLSPAFDVYLGQLCGWFGTDAENCINPPPSSEW
jgi:hypothetical protein